VPLESLRDFRTGSVAQPLLDSMASQPPTPRLSTLGVSGAAADGRQIGHRQPRPLDAVVGPLSHAPGYPTSTFGHASTVGSFAASHRSPSYFVRCASMRSSGPLRKSPKSCAPTGSWNTGTSTACNDTAVRM